MVVFTCNSCGDTIKKQKVCALQCALPSSSLRTKCTLGAVADKVGLQVEQHSYQCRGATFSCMDCSKDFTVRTYNEHTS
jgi:hypothetical protein